MALAIHLNEAEAVAEASLAAHRSHRLEAHIDSDGFLPTVVCAETRSVELALGEGADVRELEAKVTELASDGWELTLLVPSRQLGVAHAVLRGSPVLLQPWWTEGGLVHFGRPEIP